MKLKFVCQFKKVDFKSSVANLSYKFKYKLLFKYRTDKKIGYTLCSRVIISDRRTFKRLVTDLVIKSSLSTIIDGAIKKGQIILT